MSLVGLIDRFHGIGSDVGTERGALVSTGRTLTVDIFLVIWMRAKNGHRDKPDGCTFSTVVAREKFRISAYD